jgi:hypothetical protein
MVFATDNSIYQVTPQAIAFPRHCDDLARIALVLNDPRFAEMRIAPRGGGTGTNGQSLTDGLVVDLSRHMNAIIEINVAERYARVEAGVVKDQLSDGRAGSGRHSGQFRHADARGRLQGRRRPPRRGAIPRTASSTRSWRPGVGSGMA